MNAPFIRPFKRYGIAPVERQAIVRDLKKAGTPHYALAERLHAAAATGRADAYYRLARIVARVLVSVRLRRREKWCALARQLADNSFVEERLVLQAIGWLRRGRGSSSAAA